MSKRTTALLERAFRAGVAAADPAAALQGQLPLPRAGRLLLLAVGKAGPKMARAALSWYRAQGVRPHGLLISPEAPAPDQPPLPGIRQLQAGHPDPDQGSLQAGRAVLQLLADTHEDDLVVCLISGGASALMTVPDGIDLASFRQLNRALLASGADIRELNTVRRKLCRLKGGGLARAAAPATVVALVLSDVTGDDLATIASGPTVTDPDTPADALALLRRYGISQPQVEQRLQELIRRPAQQPARATTSIVGSGRLSLDAAAAELERAGWPVTLLSAEVTGDATAAARTHASSLRRLQAGGQRRALLSGGETTVRVPAGTDGRGGRNTHFVLSLALELWGEPGISALSADTDGIDGNSAAAGAFMSPALWNSDRAQAAAALAAADSGSFLGRHGHLLVTGPTGTNVNDLRIMLLEG